MFEIKHLRTLASLEKTGSLRKTADQLFLSQSALSHQIKELEHKLSSLLFIRNSTPIQFTEQGNVLLNLAKNILPEIDKVHLHLKGDNVGNIRLSIAIACHACFQWLVPVTENFKNEQKNLQIEFIDQVFSDENEQTIDILFTDKKGNDTNYIYQAIGHFELLAVLPNHHILSTKNYLSPADFNQEVLLTYPINRQNLDIFTLFLNKNNCQPKALKQISNSHVMLQMVAANMGIATLPDWLINSLSKQSLVTVKKLGQKGVFKTLYARYRRDNILSAIIEELLPFAINGFTQVSTQAKV